MVAIWNPFGLGDLPYPVEKLNMLIATLAPGEDSHVCLLVATQLKFPKQGITFTTTYTMKWTNSFRKIFNTIIFK